MGVYVTALSTIASCAAGPAEFDVTESLGAKGTGAMDRCSALAVAATRDMLRDLPDVSGADTGVVLGTTSGSAHTQDTFVRESLTRRKPYFVNPATMPFALMNSAAARCAMWHGLTGPNSTVANGRVSGVAVLRYASRLLRAARARRLVCGAVEEYSPARARLRWHQQAAHTPLGEGAAVFLLERERPTCAPRAEVLGSRTVLDLDGDPRRTLVRCVRGVLRQTGVDPAEVATLALAHPAGPLAEAERDALEELDMLDGRALRVPAETGGDVGAALGPFQIAALVGEPEPEDTFALATLLDDDGTAGCALLRVVGSGL